MLEVTPDSFDSFDIGKQLVQFGLITVGGALVSFCFQSLRDRQQKKERRYCAIRDLIGEIDEYYRATKQIKRLLRSKSSRPCDTQWRIPTEFFEDRMVELSKIQLQLEQCSQKLKVRSDLFPDACRSRIRDEIGYAEQYYNGVVKEYVNRRVAVLGTERIAKLHDNPLLADFLGAGAFPGEIKADLDRLASGDTSSDRFVGLVEINKKRKENTVRSAEAHEQPLLARRFRRVSEECLLLALKEMRETIANLDTKNLFNTLKGND